MPPLAAAALRLWRGEDTRGAPGQRTPLNWWSLAGGGGGCLSPVVAGGRPRSAGRACQSSGARRGAAGSLSCGGEYVRPPPARRPPARVRTPHADGRTAGAGRRGGGAACTWGRAHPGPPACHGCGAALGPGRGTPGRDPSPRLLRGPEVNPGGPGTGRALLMAFPGAGPRLGSGFPRPAALSLTRCLAPVTRDRASRANSGCPGAPHGPGTPPTLRLSVPDTAVPTPQEPPLRASPASAVGARQPGLLLSWCLSGCGTCWVVPRLSSPTSIPKPSTDPESLCVFLACHSCQLRE